MNIEKINDWIPSIILGPIGIIVLIVCLLANIVLPRASLKKLGIEFPVPKRPYH